MDHRLEWAGEQNSMSTGFRWRIDWAADSGPNSMTTVFRLRWMIDWAADSDPHSIMTGFGWIIASRLRLGRRTGGIFDSVETEASAGGAVKMKAAAAGPGRSSGSLSLGWGSGLGWVVNVRTNVRRTCCFCAKTCAEHETPCTPCLMRELFWVGEIASNGSFMV